MNPLSAAYGMAARMRRRWYERHPDARRRLQHPVISVGNLVVGGSGKTPVVATIAAMLREMGERPAILSRGYARRSPSGDVVIVSDGTGVREPVARAGDEPLLLARALPGVPVIVSRDRHAAGVIAEGQLGCTVSVLDDGFQHLSLFRDVDLLLVRADDLDARVLPFGALREPLDAASAADALLVSGPRVERDDVDAQALRARLGVSTSFAVTTRFDPPRAIVPYGQPIAADSEHRVDAAPPRVVAVSGIARPQRFFDTVRRQGWTVAREMAFSDHHWFTRDDVERVRAAARDAGARMVITTEKDAVRLESIELGTDPSWAFIPMRADVEPRDTFRTWIADRLSLARRA